MFFVRIIAKHLLLEENIKHPLEDVDLKGFLIGPDPITF